MSIVAKTWAQIEEDLRRHNLDDITRHNFKLMFYRGASCMIQVNFTASSMPNEDLGVKLLSSAAEEVHEYLTVEMPENLLRLGEQLMAELEAKAGIPFPPLAGVKLH